MAKPALVTGARGFIGRYIARCLSQQGWQVIGIGHGTWSQAEWSEWGISDWHDSDVNLQSLSELTKAPDLVIHCAGSGSVAASIAEPYKDFQRTVNTTLDVLEYMRIHAPQAKLVYPSSAAVYGMCERAPIKEQSLLRPVSPYGQHKVIAENLIKEYAVYYDIKAIVVRLFSVYGAGLKKQLLWDACRRLINNENIFFGTGNETRDWLHVSDAARLLCIAADHADQACSIVNGGTGIATSNRQVLELIQQGLAGVPAPRFNHHVRAGDPQHFQADIKSVSTWGWQPEFSLADGIANYVAWFEKDSA
jgi:UDP-glucose 4-epimerase